MFLPRPRATRSVKSAATKALTKRNATVGVKFVIVASQVDIIFLMRSITFEITWGEVGVRAAAASLS